MSSGTDIVVVHADIRLGTSIIRESEVITSRPAVFFSVAYIQHASMVHVEVSSLSHCVRRRLTSRSPFEWGRKIISPVYNNTSYWHLIRVGLNVELHVDGLRTNALNHSSILISTRSRNRKGIPLIMRRLLTFVILTVRESPDVWRRSTHCSFIPIPTVCVLQFSWFVTSK